MSKCIVCNKEINQLQGRNRKRCNSCNTRIRRLRTKLAAIEYLGGSCIECGYSKHPAALEFHHRGNKDFAISNIANRSWDLIKKELDKCDLLCSNCHRIKHSSRYDDPKLLMFSAEYNGRVFK